MRRYAVTAIAATLALMLSPATPAAVVCVSSGPQLQTALNNAEANGEIDEIRLKPGLYFANPLAAGEASFDYLSNEPLILYGAAVDANNNCTSVAARSDQAVLSGTDQFAVMRIVANTGASGAWSIGHLTITNGVSSQSLVGGLGVRALGGSPILSVINIIVKNGSNNAQANPQPTFRAYTEGSSSMRVLGSVFRDNTIGTYTPILLTGSAGTSISFSNNTVAYNWADASEGAASAVYTALEAGGGVALYMSNNVFYGNRRGSAQALIDFSIDTDFNPLQMDHNHFGTYSAFGVTDAFRTQGDPRFVSASDLRLRLNSPLRNSGTNTPQGGIWTVDVEGSTRIQGGTVDRGAYEYGEMFINGFE
ncbi:MAG: choice-of-anchor Q domain-containing protein [Lysobacterales bacterium]